MQNAVKKILAEIGDKLVTQLRTELKNQGHIATGELHDSIDYEIKTLGRNTTLTINAEGVSYAALVNDGSPPHFPNIQNILDWMDVKGITPEDDKTKKQVLIPPRVGNGFLVLSDSSVFHYKWSYPGSYPDVDDQFTIKWNDPEYNIYWPVEKPILQLRDK